MHLHPDRRARRRHPRGPGQPRAARAPGDAHGTDAHRGHGHHQQRRRRARRQLGLHVCKGNYLSQWIGAGDYDLTAKAFFQRLTNFDRFLLEYEDERSGSFEPLAHVPDDKAVVLGLVSSKTTELEEPAALTARVHEAARHTGLERLGISTQCGFSSVLIGANLTNEDVEVRKLELVAEVAHSIW